MKISALIILLLAIASCTGNTSNESVSADTVVAVDPTLATPPPQAVPALQFFSSTDSVMAVIDGAGCGYSAPGVTGDSSLFAFSIDGVIQVDGRLQILKSVGEGTYTDSTGESRWENASYRLDLRVMDDSVMEGGVNQHGEMTVQDKRNGAKTTVALVGGCGC